MVNLPTLRPCRSIGAALGEHHSCVSTLAFSPSVPPETSTMPESAQQTDKQGDSKNDPTDYPPSHGR